jgi:hypothetical protein
MNFEITHINYGEKKPYQCIREGSEEDWGARIAELARKGAKLGDCGKMCTDCAFKHPQEGTQDYYNAIDGAVKVLLMGGVFNCHTEDHQDAGRLCVGMLYAKQFTDKEDAET